MRPQCAITVLGGTDGRRARSAQTEEQRVPACSPLWSRLPAGRPSRRRRPLFAAAAVTGGALLARPGDELVLFR